LKAEVPIVNSAATDPTIPETIIPWYLTVLQDDRVQSYTLARRIYTDLGLSRVAILRINDRYGRFGVGKFKDASRRLGHPVVIEQKYLYGDVDFERQLRVINDSRVDAILLWGDSGPAGSILKQMRAMGMKQPVFGSFRVLGEDLFKNAGGAAEGLEVVFPYDPNRTDDPQWRGFQDRYWTRFQTNPETLASLSYDGMKVLLDSICRAGLNRGLIRDALTGREHYKGVTGEMVFDPNCKNIAPMYLGIVKDGKVQFRRYAMDKPYASTRETPVEYTGPPTADMPAGDRTIVVFGPHADQLAASERIRHAAGLFRVVGIDSETSWGKASTELVALMYETRTLGVIATDRKSSHLALQLANKVQLPVIALTDDVSITGLNIPWIFRLPAATTPEQALGYLVDGASKARANREDVRRVLASGAALAGQARFEATGEPKR
jgi:ABC-type branched-subunit amino acid transport system substrate-binding protein